MLFELPMRISFPTSAQLNQSLLIDSELLNSLIKPIIELGKNRSHSFLGGLVKTVFHDLIRLIRHVIRDSNGDLRAVDKRLAQAYRHLEKMHRLVVENRERLTISLYLRLACI